MDCELRLISSAKKIETLKTLINDLTKSLESETALNENETALREAYRKQLSEQEEIYRKQSEEYENVKSLLNRLKTEVIILWSADCIIGAGLLVYGLVTNDVPLMITGGSMAFVGICHFVFKFP